MQFRYYGKDHVSNYPQMNLYYEHLLRGTILRNYGKVSKLGIQARPGTTFYLNSSQNPIVVGATGIYELDFENVGRISAIRFAADSLKLNEVNNERIFIDIIYEGSGVEL